MGINIADLPQRYQAQLLHKVIEQDKKLTKYRNQLTERANREGGKIKFDSQKEARRYDQLITLLEVGAIQDLRLQADFTLQEAYTDAQGHRVRSIRYQADFTYWQAGKYVVEDVKSKATKTRLYETKRKLLKEKFGIDISEV